MKIKLMLSKEADSTCRPQIKFLVDAEEELQKCFEAGGHTHIRCSTPFPAGIFGHQNPEIKASSLHALHNTLPIKAYFLPKAPRALMNRHTPHKTAIQLPTSGEIWLGYINPRDIPAIEKWWSKAEEEFLANALEKLTGKAPEKNPTAGPIPADFQNLGQAKILKIESAKLAEKVLPNNDASRRRGISFF